MSQLAYFTEGNTPEALVGVPPEWTPDQIGQFQHYWDSLLAGDLGARRHTRFVPGGLEYHPTKDVSLRDNFDDWLARVVCFAFSISPGALVSQMNRATAETQKGAADSEGLAPLKLWVKDLVDRLIAEDFGYSDIEFGWLDDAPPDAATLMTVNTGYVKAGIKTINEARAEIGLDPVPGGDTPEIETPTGTVPVGKALDADAIGDGGHWITHDGHHIFISDEAAQNQGAHGHGHAAKPVTVHSPGQHRSDSIHPRNFPSKGEQDAHLRNTEKQNTKTREDFDNETKRFAPTPLRDAIANQEKSIETSPYDNGYGARRPDDDSPPDRFTKYGRYQISDANLYALGLKSGLGSANWTTNFAALYGIKSDDDFLDGPNASAAQDAALGQLAEDFNSNLNKLYDSTAPDGTMVGGAQFKGVLGDTVTITKAGLAMALHHHTKQDVQSYFSHYNLDDTYRKNLSSLEKDIETRLHAGQNIDYDP